jgi:hypothetical protein
MGWKKMDKRIENIDYIYIEHSEGRTVNINERYSCK